MKGSPIEKIVEKVFLIFFILGGLLYFSIGTIFNGGFFLAMKWLAAPIAILMLIITVFDCSRLTGTRNRFRKFMTYMFLYYPLITLFSWPIFLGVNAVTTTGEAIAIVGPVAKKSTSGGNRHSYEITIHDKKNNNNTKISIPKRNWDQVRIGDIYKFCYMKGGFGVPYYWRFKGRPECSDA